MDRGVEGRKGDHVTPAVDADPLKFVEQEPDLARRLALVVADEAVVSHARAAKDVEAALGPQQHWRRQPLRCPRLHAL